MEFYLSDDISVLGLSTRASNLLHRANVHTVEDLLNFPPENFSTLKNSGAKTVDELLQVVGNLQGVESLETPDILQKTFISPVEKAGFIAPLRATFWGKDGEEYIDIPVAKLELGRRAYTCLIKANIQYASQLVHLQAEELRGIRNMGQKSIAEILTLQSTLTFLKISNAKETSDAERTCQSIVKAIVKRVNIHGGDLFQQMMPLYNTYRETTQPTFFDIENCAEFIETLYHLPILRNALKASITRWLSDSLYGLSNPELFQVIPSFMQNDVLFTALITELENEGVLYRRGILYYKKRISIVDYAKELTKEQDQMILSRRLQGQTLETIGQACGLTRARIQQIVSNKISLAPQVKEDIYSLLYQNYQIGKDDFLFAFKEPISTYIYLHEKYKGGSLLIEEIIFDDQFPTSFHRAAEKIIYKNCSWLDGKYIPNTRNDLILYLLRTIGTEGIVYSELQKQYYSLLSSLNLQDDSTLSVMERGYENKLAGSSHVLWKYGKKMRYYDIQSHDFTELLSTLDLYQYKDVELSTRKFFIDYPELMVDYDILDEYELHNLLKKICTKEQFPLIQFKRMPNIEFGTANRDKQIFDLLLLHAPILNTDFAELYEKQYGTLSQTVLANHCGCISKYVHERIYTIDAPVMSAIMAMKMSETLTKDFYFLSEVVSIYTSLFPSSDTALINPYNLKELGFHVYASYVVHTRYDSAADYFKWLLTSQDLVALEQLPSNISYISSFSAEFHKLRETYEIIEYSLGGYLNFRRLAQISITKDDLANYTKELFRFVKTPYFTISSIQSEGFTHALDELGFEELFYASLLAEDKEQFSHLRIGGNRLFRRGTGQVLLADFLEFIVYSTESMSYDLSDLIEFLKSVYRIVLNTHKVLDAVKKCQMYYSPVTKRIYADYDVYFDSIEG
ncbi:MAG: DNA-directed RNA polymerase subunit alpha C-terminal domain-containing protein [Faecalibacterium sp.]